MLDIRKHRLILLQILKDIYCDSQLGPLLVFKGGTCAHLFYGLPRFSIDLDFNLLALDNKRFVFGKVKDIIEKYGEIKECREKRFTLFFLLSYEEKAQNIKVEISKKVFPNHYEIRNYLGIPMLILKKEDMFSHKLASLLERRNIANRDLFDIWFFSKNNWDFNKELLELRVKMGWKAYLKKCIEEVEKIDERYILQGLGELPNTQQKVWIKSNLKKEVIFLLKFYMGN